MKPPAIASATRRKQILEGARRAFARHGYEGATVARLEEEIGLSRGAIFNYFPDKWSVFYELASRDQHELTTLLMEQGLDATIRHLTTESPDWKLDADAVLKLIHHGIDAK